MINNIFLPERVGNYFLFSRSYLGLEINKNFLVATKVSVSGSRATIQEFYHESVHKNDDVELEKNLVDALDILFKKIGSRAKVHLSLPNYVVVFKELTLPFLDVRKIRQTLAFELEQHIPFSINEVVFDFIVTHRDEAARKTTIFVAIAQKKDVQYFVQLLEKAGVSISGITVDLFAFLGLYQANQTYQGHHDQRALIDIGTNHTIVAQVEGPTLRATRSINLGINSVAKNFSVQTPEEQTTIIQNLLHSGLNSGEQKSSLSDFVEQLKFTLNAFAAQTTGPAKSAVIITRGAKIAQLDVLLGKELGIDVKYFDVDTMIGSRLELRRPMTHIPHGNIISLGAAFPFGAASTVDLLSVFKPDREIALVRNQLVTACVLLLTLFGALLGNWYFQYHQLSQQGIHAKRAIITSLTDKFRLEGKQTYKSALEASQEKVEREEAIWSGFTQQARTSFLQDLQELSTIIDREAIGLNLAKVTIDKNSVTLVGKVGGYNELKVFEQALESSQLLKPTKRLQDPAFEIKLSIKGGDRHAT